MNLSFIKKNRKKTAPMNGLLSKNPVLIKGLALAPVIVASTTVKNALVLSIGMAITTVPTMLISLFIRRKQGSHWMHILLYMLCAAVSYIPAAFLIRGYFPTEMGLVGIYLPMVVVNSIPISRAQMFVGRRKRGFLVVDMVFQVLGFTLAIFLVAAIREFFGAGTLFGVDMETGFSVPTLLYPFGGFFVVAFLAALFQKGNELFKRAVDRMAEAEEEARAELEEMGRLMEREERE